MFTDFEKEAKEIFDFYKTAKPEKGDDQ